jgi:hypothetical protein
MDRILPLAFEGQNLAACFRGIAVARVFVFRYMKGELGMWKAHVLYLYP